MPIGKWMTVMHLAQLSLHNKCVQSRYCLSGFYNGLIYSSRMATQQVGFVIETQGIPSLPSTSVEDYGLTFAASGVLSSSLQWCSR